MTDTEQLILAIEKCLFSAEHKECGCTEAAEKFIESRLAVYKAQVEQQAYYIGCLVEQVRKLNEK